MPGGIAKFVDGIGTPRLERTHNITNRCCSCRGVIHHALIHHALIYDAVIYHAQIFCLDILMGANELRPYKILPLPIYNLNLILCQAV